MSDEEFKALIDWYASSADWQGWNSMSVATCDAINTMVDRECRSRGYHSWEDAHHRLLVA